MHYSQIDLYTTSNQMKADLVLDSCSEEVSTFMRRLLELLIAYDFQTNDVFAIQLAVEEALVNAMKHGNQMDRSKRVHVAIALGIKSFRIRIKDEGKGFDPTQVADSTAPDNPERSSGRGLWLIRHYMHEVRYNSTGTTVTLIRQRSSAS